MPQAGETGAQCRDDATTKSRHRDVPAGHAHRGRPRPRRPSRRGSPEQRAADDRATRRRAHQHRSLPLMSRHRQQVLLRPGGRGRELPERSGSSASAQRPRIPARTRPTGSARPMISGSATPASRRATGGRARDEAPAARRGIVAGVQGGDGGREEAGDRHTRHCREQRQAEGDGVARPPRRVAPQAEHQHAGPRHERVCEHDEGQRDGRAEPVAAGGEADGAERARPAAAPPETGG